MNDCSDVTWSCKHELTAYLTWAKVGEKSFHLRVKSHILSLSGVQESL